MKTRFLHTCLIRLVLLCACLVGYCTASAQDSYRDEVYLVFIEVESPKDVEKCFGPDFDIKKITLDFDFEDPINNLEDFSIEEEAMFGPDCFIPEMKLVFRKYTYVFSLYCSRVVKYKNSAPFTPTSVKMKNDIIFTSSVYDILENLRHEHHPYGGPNPSLLRKFVSSEPLSVPVDEEMEKYLNDEDDDEDDLDEEDKKLLDDDGGR